MKINTTWNWKGISKARNNITGRNVIRKSKSFTWTLIKLAIGVTVVISLLGGIGSLFGSGGMHALNSLANQARQLNESILPDEISNIIENQIDSIQNSLEGYDPEIYDDPDEDY